VTVEVASPARAAKAQSLNPVAAMAERTQARIASRVSSAFIVKNSYGPRFLR
jgi:hypothetical protein